MTIKNIFAIAALAAIIGAAPMARANDDNKNQAPKLKFRIAVNQGKWEELRWNNYTVDNDVVRSMQAKIIDKLQKSGMFEIMDREAGEETQRRNEDSLAAERDARNQQQGRQTLALRDLATPADYIITPEIVGFNVTSRKGNSLSLGGLAQAVGLGGIVQGANVSNGSVKATAEIALRISNAESSSILDSATGKGEQEQKNSRLDASILGAGVSQDQFSDSPVGKAIELAINEAVNQMVSRMSKMPWKALVASISQKTGRITINRGTASGITEGMEFTVYEVDEDGVDPETNTRIPGDEVAIGKIRVVRVENNYAFADVVSGTGFKPKNVIRLK
jgi:curli biogenesis system outer membrane secretion channel CsgG